jgi:hypothetical protein
VKRKSLRLGAAGILIASSMVLGSCEASDTSGNGRDCTDYDTGMSADAINDGDRCSDSD